VVGAGTPQSCTEDALRSALAEGGNVTFDCGAADVTIAIEQEITVSADTILDGGGTVTLDGGGTSRILHTEARVALTVVGLHFVRGRATETAGELASGSAIRSGWLASLDVFDCTFTDNHAADTGIEGGGAIYQASGGRLRVVRSTFTGNSAISGGAIDNLLSDLTIVESSFVDNEAFAGGGSIYVDGASEYTDDDVGGTVSICGCRFEGNTTLSTGGAVYLYAYYPDRYIISQCSFVGNSARRPPGESALGGALRTGNAPLQLSNSLFSGNHADVHGGAYWQGGDFPASITNCTFFQNTAGVEGEEGGYGGALSGFNMQLSHLTFVENHAEWSGGAISSEGDAWTLDNSLFLNNTSNNPWDQSQTCVGEIPGGNNLQWPAPEPGDSPCSSGIALADPLLGDLSDNGGPTLTIPLLPDSPALGAAEGCATTDQRGEARPSPCDIGAFEAP
jgi:predicted outer membrane repeat protein